jgi:hypothetical protein
MALRAMSIDEETAALADAYDGLIAPKKLWRNHNNKLYLLLRAYAAGKIGLNDAVLALRNRFDPLYCDETDLYSTAKLVGTDFRKGSGSILSITVVNTALEEQKILAAGTYNYQSAAGMVFSFEIAGDYSFDPEEVKVVSAISRSKGSYAVSANADIKLYRSDGAAIDRAFMFSCEDNAGQLGYEDEDAFAFRQRILSDSNRQDHIKELELKIRNLPNIFECNLLFNPDVQPAAYDGIILAPMELLVTITGVPTDEIARLVVEEVIYITHMTDPDQVVYYENACYVNGRMPVYYRFHGTADFALDITYQYDPHNLKSTQVEAAIRARLDRYVHAVTYTATINEYIFYRLLDRLELSDANILNIGLMVGGVRVPHMAIPKTRLPHLTGITFHPVTAGDDL